MPHPHCFALAREERIPERSSHNILPMEGLAGEITRSLHESNFACYNCINSVTSTADEYNFNNIKICGRTVEEDYPLGTCSHSLITQLSGPAFPQIPRPDIHESGMAVVHDLLICAI